MFAQAIHFIERLQYNLKAGELSDMEAFMYYGLIILLGYYLAIGRTRKSQDMKLYSMVLAGAGLGGVVINRYRRAALGAREKIYQEEGLSKDTAFLVTNPTVAI